MTRTRLDQIADRIKGLEAEKSAVGKLGAARLSPDQEMTVDAINTKIRALEIERQQITVGRQANIAHKDPRTGKPL
jgi:hypothetical protein